MSLARLTCREASRLQSQAMDRSLSLGERWSLKLHTSVCDACSRVERQLGFLRRAIQERSDPGDDGRH